MFKVNLDKAKEITKEKLREERNPLLEALDLEALKNVGNPEVLAEIEIKKQALRDITKEADKAKSVDELKRIKI